MALPITTMYVIMCAALSLTNKLINKIKSDDLTRNMRIILCININVSRK